MHAIGQPNVVRHAFLSQHMSPLLAARYAISMLKPPGYARKPIHPLHLLRLLEGTPHELVRNSAGALSLVWRSKSPRALMRRLLLTLPFAHGSERLCRILWPICRILSRLPL